MTRRRTVIPVYVRPLPSRRDFLLRFVRTIWVAGVLLLIGLGAGILGYRFIVGLDWIDALLNASMILAGEGPINPTPTAGGKLFASAYALFSGLVFVGVAAILVAPILRRTLHHFHLDDVIDEVFDPEDDPPEKVDPNVESSS